MDIRPGVVAVRFMTGVRQQGSGALGRLLVPALLGIALAIAAGIALATVSPREEAGAPLRLGSLYRSELVQGPPAKSYVDRIHGLGITLSDAYIATYSGGGDKVVAWVGTAGSHDDAARLLERMVVAIADGSPVYSNLQRHVFSGLEVYEVDGPGGRHFFYVSRRSGTLLVWLTIAAADPESALALALEEF